MTVNEERILKNTIKKLVRESIFDLINGGVVEKKKDSDKNKEGEEKEKSKISDKRKKRVILGLKNKLVDVAQYAYKLWPEKKKSSARSYFYKCLDGKKNDTGDVYTFTDEEYIRLESMLTDVILK